MLKCLNEENIILKFKDTAHKSIYVINIWYPRYSYTTSL